MASFSLRRIRAPRTAATRDGSRSSPGAGGFEAAEVSKPSSHRLRLWIRSPSSCRRGGRRGGAPPRARGRDPGRRRARGGGDPDRVAFRARPRSRFQALPLVRARDDLTTRRSRSPARRTSRSPEQLAAVRSLLAKAPARRTSSSAGRSRRRSSTTAPASTRGCSRSAAPRAGRAAATGSRRTRSSRRCSQRSRPRPRSSRERDPDGDRRLRRARPSRCRSSGWRPRSAGSSRSTAAPRGRARCARIRSCSAGRSARGRAADAGSRRLGGEGRSRRASLRGAPDGLGHRAQGRGRRACARSAPRSRSSSARLGFDPGELGIEPVENSRGELVGEVVRRSREEAVEFGSTSGAVRCRIRALDGQSRGRSEPAFRLPDRSQSPSRREESEVHALRRYRPPRGRGAAQARRARAGEGLPHLRRDRQRARGRRADEGADRGLLHLPDRPLDRARRRRAAQAAAARAARARRGREGGAEARPHRRAVARLAAALPARDRQGAAADRRPGGVAREAHRARRHGARSST